MSENNLLEIVGNVIKSKVSEYYETTIDEINIFLSDIFPGDLTVRESTVKLFFLLFILHAERNEILKEEAVRIYHYLNGSIKEIYIYDDTIIDSMYLMMVSLMESEFKSRDNGSFVKKLDSIITRNIKRSQAHPSVDYDPIKTPILRELLIVLTPFFDLLDVEKMIEEGIDRHLEFIDDTK